MLEKYEESIEYNDKALKIDSNFKEALASKGIYKMNSQA